MRENLRTVHLFVANSDSDDICIAPATIADTAEGQVRTFMHVHWWPHEDYEVAREHWGP